MEILGYVAYAILAVLAVTWAFGIRVKLGTSAPTIIGSLFFLLSAIIIPVTDTSFIHALWLIPLGYSLSLLTARLMPRSRLLSSLVVLIASFYASILRIGIDARKIEAEQVKATYETVENWAERQGKSK